MIALILFGCDVLPEPMRVPPDASGDVAIDVVSRDNGVDANLPDADAEVPDTEVPDARVPDMTVDADNPDMNIPDAVVIGPTDELNLSGITWLHPDISSWPITTELSVSFSSNNVCLAYDKKNSWPTVQIFGSTDVVANAWVFARSQGSWHAGTFEWMRPGQECKAQSSVDGNHIKVSPFNESSGWEPESGEEVYFMVSGLIRNPTYRNVMERSNVVRAIWP